MLIRSQDNLKLINFDSIPIITIDKDCTKDIWRFYALLHSDPEENFVMLGEYYSQEKAVYVLDQIEHLYKTCLFSDHAFDQAAVVQRPYIFAENKVFQMPADEEISED